MRTRTITRLVTVAAAATLAASEARATTAEDIPLDPVAREDFATIEPTSTCAAECGPRCSYKAGQLVDGRLWSAWAAAPGSRAPALRLDLGRTRYLVRMDVVIGDARNRATFDRSERPTRLVVTAGGARREHTLADRAVPQSLHFDPPIEARTIELAFESDARAGDGTCGVALSELVLWEPHDVLALRPELRAEIEVQLRGLEGADAAAAEAALVRIGAPATTSILLALRSAPAAITPALARVLAGVGDRRGATAVLERLERATPSDRLPLLDALGRLPDDRAVATLARIAERGRPEEQTAAVRALVGIEGPSVAAALAPLVRHPEADLAALAAEGLARRDPAAAVALLPSLAAASVDVQRAAVTHLPDQLPTDTRRALRAALGTFRDEVVRAAILGRSCAGGDTAAVEEAIRLLRRTDPEVREGAARCLAVAGAPSEVLLDLAFDELPLVRDQALRALVTRGGRDLAPLAVAVLDAAPAEIGPYVTAVSGLPSEERRRTALLWTRYGLPSWRHEVARLVGPAGLPALREALELVRLQEPDRDALVALLATTPDAWRSAAAEALREGLWAVEPGVVRVFAAVARPTDVPLLDPLLASGDPRLSEDLADALGHLGGADAESRLIALVAADQPTRVRVRAAEALGRVGGTAAAAALGPFVSEPPEELAAVALEIVGRIEGEAALPLLERAFLEGPLPVQRAALVACRRLGSPEALRLLGQAAVSPDPSLRSLGMTLLADR